MVVVHATDHFTATQIAGKLVCHQHQKDLDGLCVLTDLESSINFLVVRGVLRIFDIFAPTVRSERKHRLSWKAFKENVWEWKSSEEI